MKLWSVLELLREVLTRLNRKAPCPAASVSTLACVRIQILEQIRPDSTELMPLLRMISTRTIGLSMVARPLMFTRLGIWVSIIKTSSDLC